MSKMIDLVRNVAGLDDSILQSANLSMLRQTLESYRTEARAAIEETHEFTVTRTSDAFRCAICDKARSEHYF